MCTNVYICTIYWKYCVKYCVKYDRYGIYSSITIPAIYKMIVNM